MSEQEFFKAECPFCGQHIEVPVGFVEWINCPNETCGKSFPPFTSIRNDLTQSPPQPELQAATQPPPVTKRPRNRLVSTTEPETRPTYVTCKCNHCPGSIEFDVNALTEESSVIPCPHCGLETKLFIQQTSASPQPQPAPNPAASATSPAPPLKSGADGAIYLHLKNERRGPFAKSQVFSMWNNGLITSDSFYWREGMSDWAAISELVREFAISSPPPPMPQRALPTQASCHVKTDTLAGTIHRPASLSPLRIGCLGVFCVFIWLYVIGMFVGDKNTGVRSAAPAPFPTDPATQEKLKVGILQYTASGVFTDVKVYNGDQAWVYVSDRFSKLPFGEKEMTVAAIYSVLNRQNSVKFVVVYDAYTGKSVGTYHPSIGLKMD